MILTPAQPPNILNNILSKKNIKSHKNSKRLPLMKKIAATKHTFKPNNKNDGTQNVPKKSVLLEMKLQKTMQKNADEKLQSSEDHLKNIAESKQMLSDILKEYDHISKDKTILTAEIKNMKKYLMDIRLKLDQSLLVLNNSTTIFAMKKGMASKHILANKNKSSLRTKRFKKSKKIEKIEPMTKSILANSNYVSNTKLSSKD